MKNIKKLLFFVLLAGCIIGAIVDINLYNSNKLEYHKRYISTHLKLDSLNCTNTTLSDQMLDLKNKVKSYKSEIPLKIFFKYDSLCIIMIKNDYKIDSVTNVIRYNNYW